MKKLFQRLKCFYARGAEERTQVHILMGFIGLPLLVLLPFCFFVFFYGD